MYKYLFFYFILSSNISFLNSTNFSAANNSILDCKVLLIKFVEGLLYNPINEAIDLSITIKESNLNIIEKESKLIDIVEFLYLTKTNELHKNFDNIDILKSVLFGSIYNSCSDRKIVEESLLWNIYQIAKQNKFKSLMKFIRNKTFEYYYIKKLPDISEDIKENVIAKFIN